MTVYGRMREQRLSQAIKKVARTLLPDSEWATDVQHRAAGERKKAITPFNTKELWLSKTNGGGGNRTRVRKPLATASTCLSGEYVSQLANLPSRAGKMLA
ncbi:hypothetical protein NKDENANG_03998 [Candidatus Entotheonellaceae bacterium PAL068K]